MDRRNFLKTAGTAGAVGLTGLSGCIGNLGGSGASTVSFSLTPAESDVDVKKQYEPLFEYLESEADVEIESTVAADYSAVFQSLKSGQTDLADAAPAIAIQSGNEDVAEVAGIRIAYGAAKYFSMITTLPEYEVDSLTDLEGETIAFADALSTSGSLFPLYGLSQAGLDVGSAPNGDAEDFTGQWSDHSTARETLRERDEVKAAGTGAFSVASHVTKEAVKEHSDKFADISAEWPVGGKTDEYELDVLHVSQPIPRAPILARTGMDEDVKEDCIEALTSATEDDLIDPDSEEELWFTGLVDGSVEDYAPVEEVINDLGLELGQS